MPTMHALPDELWSGIFELLCAQELHAASQVCMRWRCVAFDCPMFWGHVYLNSLSPGELGWAGKRTAAGNARPVSLRICLACDSGELEGIVLPLIRTVLHRARVLHIAIPNTHFEKLCQILRGNAPMLEELWLDMSVPEDFIPTMVLPADIFGAASGCPILRDVHLECISLPSCAVPAFKYAESVLLASADSGWHNIPTDLFDRFPSVRSLALAGGGPAIAENAPLSMAQGFARLDTLNISYYEMENVTILRRFPSPRAISDIFFGHSDGETVRAAISQLSDQLMLVLTPMLEAERSIRVLYSSHDGKRHRAFTDELKDFEPGQMNAVTVVLSEPTFKHRVVSLRVAASLWQIAVPFFPHGSDNHLEDIAVLLDRDSTHAHGSLFPRESLSCPRLRIIAVQALGDFVRLSVGEIIEFARVVVRHRVALELHLVVLSGAQEELDTYFETVLYLTERLQS